jgi:hypothetical protein
MIKETIYCQTSYRMHSTLFKRSLPQRKFKVGRSEPKMSISWRTVKSALVNLAFLMTLCLRTSTCECCLVRSTIVSTITS